MAPLSTCINGHRNGSDSINDGQAVQPHGGITFVNEFQRRKPRAIALFEEQVLAVRGDDDLDVILTLGELDRLLLRHDLFDIVADVWILFDDLVLDCFLHGRL